MIDFIITKKSDETKKAVIKIDMIDGNIEKCTVMYISGVKGTEFETVLPWRQGSVTSMTEIKQWAQENVTNYTMYEYEGNNEAVVVAEEEQEDDDED